MGKVMYMRKGDAHTAPVAPVKGIPASDLAVGNSVFLRVNGVLKEFLIVNKGIPGNSSLYDASCDGVWLLMKDIYESRVWHSSLKNEYDASDIHTYLNDTFLNLLDADVKTQIKTVKIPYRKKDDIQGAYVATGANGLSAKIFLLSGYEIGAVQMPGEVNGIPIEGSCLTYFNGISSTTNASSKRKACLNGTATEWWVRTPKAGSNYHVYYVQTDGAITWQGSSMSYGVRPALIVPHNALFDEETMELIGVAA